VLIKREEETLPSPFKILIKVVFAYIKGQIQARVTINFPAVPLWNSKFPIKLPVNRKPAVQRQPRKKTQPVTFLISPIKALRLFCVCTSAMVGRSMVAMEPVSAEGKKIQGIAIPVRTP